MTSAAYLFQPGNTTATSYSDCTLADGTYQISAAPAGSYDVAFSDPTGLYSTQWYDGTTAGASTQSGAVPVAVTDGGTVSVNATMALGQGNVSGTVTSASTGAALGDVCEYLYQPGGTTDAYSSCTLANGTFQVTGVASGSYDVAFSDPTGLYATQWYDGTAAGASTQSGAVPVAVTDGGTVSVNATMALGQGNVSGTVTSASTGAALGDVCEYLYQPGGTTDAYSSCTLANGTFQVTGVASGSYDVAFSDPTGLYATQWYDGTAAGASTQYGAVAVTVTNGGTVEVDATMAPGQGTLSGTVTSASTGAALGDVCAYLYQPGSTSGTPYADCTLADGTYSVNGAQAGSYDVEFYDPQGLYVSQWYNGTAAGASTQSGAVAVAVTPGGTVEVDASMALGQGTLSGTVTSASTGAALGDVCAYLYQPGSTSGTPYADCTLDDGTYQVSGARLASTT